MEQKFITSKNIDKFRTLYLKAKAKKQEVFIFESQDVLVQYAKYVLEYYDTTHGSG